MRATVSSVVLSAAEQRLDLAPHQLDSPLPLRAIRRRAGRDPLVQHHDEQLRGKLGRCKRGAAVDLRAGSRPRNLAGVRRTSLVVEEIAAASAAHAGPFSAEFDALVS